MSYKKKRIDFNVLVYNFFNNFPLHFIYCCYKYFFFQNLSHFYTFFCFCFVSLFPCTFHRWWHNLDSGVLNLIDEFYTHWINFTFHEKNKAMKPSKNNSNWYWQRYCFEPRTFKRWNRTHLMPSQTSVQNNFVSCYGKLGWKIE